jgi:ankyrin repeat protein
MRSYLLLQAVKAKKLKGVKAALSGRPIRELVEAFATACRLGHKAIVKILMRAIEDEAPGFLREGLVPAVQGRHRDIVDLLQKRHVDHVEGSPTPEGEAAALGDLELMKALDGLNAVWNPDHTREAPQDWWGEVATAADGYSPLLNAIRGGHLEAVRRLVVDHKVEVNRNTHAGRSALDFAEALGHEDIATLLREHGATALDRVALPLFQLVFYGLVDEARERLMLLRQKAEQSLAEHGYVQEKLLPTGEGVEGLGRVFGIACYKLAQTNRIEAAQLVTLMRPFLDQRELDDALGTAAARGHVRALRLLLELGAKVNSYGKHVGRTPLIWASANGHLAVIRELLKAGANIDKGSKGDRQSALAEAIWNDRPEAACLLIDAGADPNVVAADGSTPMAKAKNSRFAGQLVPQLTAAGGRDTRKEILKSLKSRLKKDKRKAFRLLRSRDAPASTLSDRIGGQPFLSKRFPRPRSESGAPLALIIQLDLQGHPEKRKRQAALLQVFYDASATPCARARLVTGASVESHCPDEGPALPLQSVAGYSRARADFPHPADGERGPVELSEAEQSLLPYLVIGGDKVGGWPDWIQDPSYPECERELLLQLADGGLANVSLGDAANLYIFQNRQADPQLTVLLQCY